MMIPGIIFTGVLIYQANMVYLRGRHDDYWLRLSLYLLLSAGIMIGLYVLVMSTTDPSMLNQLYDETETGQFPKIDSLSGILFFAFCAGLSIPGFLLVQSRAARVTFASIIRVEGIVRRYNPDSPVHTTAIVLALFQLVNTVGTYILAGGIEGLADDLSVSGLDLGTLLLNFALYILLALLGVGLYIRRDGSGTLQRLGITVPDRRTLVWGMAGGFILFWFQVGMLYLWQSIVSPETLAEQTAAAEQLFTVFQGSTIAALVLAITTGIGEELLFRGALQPIFGNVLVSIFFASLHTQYLFTPAMLVIFGVSLGFGWLRSRLNTTSAIIAHFIYNLIPFMLVWLAG